MSLSFPSRKKKKMEKKQLYAVWIDASSSAELYVGGLDEAVDPVAIATEFKRFGVEPDHVRLQHDRETRRSLGVAYVNFSSVIKAANAMRMMGGRTLKGKAMRISWSVRDPPPRKTGSGELFVENLEDYVGESELKLIFYPYGRVISCEVAVDDNGRSKGHAFVQMGCEEAAKSAISGLDGTIPPGGNKKLSVVTTLSKPRASTMEVEKGSNERPEKIKNKGKHNKIWKKAKELKKHKANENIEAEAFIANAENRPSKKRKKH